MISAPTTGTIGAEQGPVPKRFGGRAFDPAVTVAAGGWLRMTRLRTGASLWLDRAAALSGEFLAADPENSEYTWMRNARGLSAAPCPLAPNPADLR